MNAQRRKQIAEAVALIGAAQTLLEIVRDEEQDAFDNMPEGLQGGERGQKMEAAVSAIEEAFYELDDILEALATASE